MWIFLLLFLVFLFLLKWMRKKHIRYFPFSFIVFLFFSDDYLRKICSIFGVSLSNWCPNKNHNFITKVFTPNREFLFTNYVYKVNFSFSFSKQNFGHKSLVSRKIVNILKEIIKFWSLFPYNYSSARWRFYSSLIAQDTRDESMKVSAEPPDSHPKNSQPSLKFPAIPQMCHGIPTNNSQEHTSNRISRLSFIKIFRFSFIKIFLFFFFVKFFPFFILMK